jgi:hypothetical protein
MRFTYVLLALAVAAPASAQQGAPITAKDIERLDPARIILARRDALKLQKEQIAVLDSMRKAFDDSAKKVAEDVRRHQRAITTPPPLLRRPPDGRPETRKDSLDRAKLDSTNRVKRDRYFETVTTGRRDLATGLLALKELFDSTLASTIKALDGSQHTSAALSLERASEEFTRRLRLANVR